MPICTDSRRREWVVPTRILWAKGVEGDPKELLHPGAGTASPWSIQSVRLAAGGGLLLDFGTELFGGIRIISGDNQPRRTRIRLRFGESVSEAMHEPDNDHAIHDTILDCPWQGTLETGHTGFRFVRIDAVSWNTDSGNEPVSIELREVGAVSVFHDLPWQGSFQCDDERLNQIWHTGARTVHLCMQTALWDGIKRDQLIWVGDLFPEMQVIASVFGEVGVVSDSLEQVREETPLPGWMNGIPSYTLWWIVSQQEWYWIHGRRDRLGPVCEYLKALFPMLQSVVDPSTGAEQLPDFRFLDWTSHGDAGGIHAGLQALFVQACRAGAVLLREGGDTRTSGRYRDLQQLLSGHRPAHGDNKAAASLKVWAGLADALHVNSELLSDHPEQGFSPFMGAFVLQARHLAGDEDGAMEMIRRFWGRMLDLGATTFWEAFNPVWAEGAAPIDRLCRDGEIDLHRTFGEHCYTGLRHSLCHGWSAGPTAWLSRVVLGLSPAEPGYRRLKLDPRPGSLQWVRGTMPTPQGPVTVEHERDTGGKWHTTLEAPDDIEIVDPRGVLRSRG